MTTAPLAKIGSRLLLNDGYTHETGTVYAIEKDRFGTQIKVKMTDFDFRYVSDIIKKLAPGEYPTRIGAYQIS